MFGSRDYKTAKFKEKIIEKILRIIFWFEIVESFIYFAAKSTQAYLTYNLFFGLGYSKLLSKKPQRMQV